MSYQTNARVVGRTRNSTIARNKYAERRPSMRKKPGQRFCLSGSVGGVNEKHPRRISVNESLLKAGVLWGAKFYDASFWLWMCSEKGNQPQRCHVAQRTSWDKEGSEGIGLGV